MLRKESDTDWSLEGHADIRPAATLAAPLELSSRPIAIWLFTCCAMVFAMVVLGGVTRLTHSGLSIVEWKPVSGIVPPWSEADWEQTFRQYRQYPEYQKLNPDMSLEGFKRIYWLEYLHRLWGRVIGLVFLLPLLYFWRQRMLAKSLLPRLMVVFALGGMQGGLGWLMVKSGLVDRPDVSQYRLVAHLGLAALIYGYLFWMVLGLLFPEGGGADRGLRRAACGLTGLIFATILAGGLVAGTDAGFAYNTFPLMDGRVVPQEMWVLDPPWRNLFENITTVQFNHRLLAMLSLAGAVGLWLWALRLPLSARLRAVCHALVAAAVMQVALGIATLLLSVPVALAAIHQAGALVLLAAALWVVHELRPGPHG